MTISDDLAFGPAVEVLNPDGASDVVLVCEHASRHIPPGYNGLGVGAADLQRHIAWDIGAAEVTRHLSALLDAPAFLATSSRLLIDLNRPLDSPSSIVVHSEATAIPGNVDLAEAERQRRAAEIFTPFHAAIGACLDARQGQVRGQGRPVRLVSIHSFTPVYLGVARIWHAGVLFDQAKAFGQAMVERLQEPGLNVGANVPYQSGRTEDYAVPIHGDDRGIPAVLIEIRQDLIGEAAGALAWAERLARVLMVP